MNRLKDRLILGFKIYDEKLNNKRFLIAFENNNVYDFIEIVFVKSNFLHLTGIIFDGSPNEFYKKLSRNQLNLNTISEKADGTTRLKLDVLTNVESLFRAPSNIGDYNKGKVNFYSDKIMGRSSGYLSLGLKYKTNNFAPQSLLKENYKSLTFDPKPVLLVMRAAVDEYDYNKVMYKNKRFDTTKITDNINGKICDINIIK